ncbi:100aa long hypothetical protein [Pyrococcus horikoshii OT3]|uniref:Uncharacterized protein n=1 Tax=Pyrococcus horikoshii (strain ATCC 700860 / DSM 12428 / JCM 9974 / NBRC 100139 / OT-3) TaxID=70601 RepID=O58804_PYRHO|nr:100aa long hypothetical protein [Pyrococcus horikoshii OT3]
MAIQLRIAASMNCTLALITFALASLKSNSLSVKFKTSIPSRSSRLSSSNLIVFNFASRTASSVLMSSILISVDEAKRLASIITSPLNSNFLTSSKFSYNI